MIISKTPFRLSFMGGGTDYPVWYKEHEGAVLATSINKYCYISTRWLPPFFPYKHRMAYSKTELVKDISEIQHPSARETLRFMNIKKGVAMQYDSDLPARAGLGTSSAFTVGLLNALYGLNGKMTTKRQLAEEAIYIEQKMISENVGSQDQITTAFGGFNKISFYRDSFQVQPIIIPKKRLELLQDHLLLFFTGFSRTASKVAGEQIKKTPMLGEELTRMYDMVDEAIDYLNHDLLAFGDLLNSSWMIKRTLTKKITTPTIDKIYKKALKAGAIGGKLCVVGDSIISLPNYNFKKIKDVEVGEYLLDSKKQPQKVLKKFTRPYVGEIIEFTITGLKDTIKVTPEHPFMITKKRQHGKRVNRKLPNIALFKKAGDLKKGNTLLTPMDSTIQECGFLKIERKKQPKYSSVDIYKRIPEKIKIDDKLLFILGWYVAEGSSSHKQFNFVLNSKEGGIASNLVSYIYDVFGIKSSIQKAQGNAIRVVGSSTVISKFLSSLCGKGAHNKMVPSFIMYLPIKKQLVFLRALWMGDGTTRTCFDKRTNKTYPRCTYKTVSFVLAKQVQEMCARSGFITSIKQEDGREQILILGNICKTRKVYIIDVTGEDAKFFTSFIKTTKKPYIIRSNKKQLSQKKELVEIDGVWYIKRSIRKIRKYEYSGNVFNLSVENTNTYIVNDIVVHNCGAGSGGFMLLFVEPEKQQKVIDKLKLLHVPFRFENQGSQIIYYTQGSKVE